jgi:RNA polymerase sigma-70 factor, ECF subfamily
MAPSRLEALFQEHYAAVLRYVSRRAPQEMVDDVVAETFLVAWRRRQDVPAEPRGWLIGVARNVIATQTRSQRRRQRLRARLASQGQEVPPPPADETALPIAAALERLSSRDREILTLIAIDELTPSEAAAVLGVSAENFRTRLHRAKRRLRRSLEEEAKDAPGQRRLRTRERTS